MLIHLIFVIFHRPSGRGLGVFSTSKSGGKHTSQSKFATARRCHCDHKIVWCEGAVWSSWKIIRHATFKGKKYLPKTQPFPKPKAFQKISNTTIDHCSQIWVGVDVAGGFPCFGVKFRIVLRDKISEENIFHPLPTLFDRVHIRRVRRKIFKDKPFGMCTLKKILCRDVGRESIPNDDHLFLKWWCSSTSRKIKSSVTHEPSMIVKWNFILRPVAVVLIKPRPDWSPTICRNKSRVFGSKSYPPFDGLFYSDWRGWR